MAAYIAPPARWAVVVLARSDRSSPSSIFYLLPPGDPALRFVGKQPTPQSIALVRHNLGLDKPWYVQYGKFVKAIVRRRQVRLARASATRTTRTSRSARRSSRRRRARSR